MDDRTAGRKPWPLGVAGALALVLLVEGLLATHRIDVTNAFRFEWGQTRDAASRLAPQANILGFGTSMTKQGLYPVVVERESGLTTLNLAQCAGRMQTMFYLLRHALEAGSRPKAILLEVHPIYMAMPYPDGMQAWSDLLDWNDQVDLAQTAFRGDFAAKTALETLFPTIRARHEIRDLIVGAFNGLRGHHQDSNQALLRHFDLNGGGFVNRRLTPYNGEVHPFIAGMYLPPTWHPEITNARFLRRILSLCRSRQIAVYWIIPPVAPNLQAGRDLLGLESAYDAFMGRVRAEYPEVAVLDARRSNFPHTAFFDAAHLDYPGAVFLSAEIGRAVKADLASRPPHRKLGPQVLLPPYCEFASEPPLEDMAQSGQVIAAAAATKLQR